MDKGQLIIAFDRGVPVYYIYMWRSSSSNTILCPLWMLYGFCELNDTTKLQSLTSH